MKVIIIGGNDCMVDNYKNLCKQYKCKVKVFTQPFTKKQIGNPDLLILFTNTVSHKMIHCALSAGKQNEVVRSHSSSMSALRDILDKHVC
ncbi:MAG: hypothetical protein BEN19_04410 [Epulopiscium sp. Nuni2H_MBin003]|nr:MAG: hypothetical protein BEN19_04410 [Epulopiscium sp. Nuni2H_MBin003]